MQYKTIVIGCGKVGAMFEIDSELPKPASHAAAFAANPNTVLAALVDPDEAQLKRAGEYYNVPTFADPAKALASIAPDIVVIATPPSTHEQLLSLTTSSGVKVIVCEKPVSDTLESAHRMIEAASKADTIVILNHQRRLFPLFERAKEKITAGELGEIQQVNAYYSNGLFNNGTHAIDALCFLLGDRIEWVTGAHNEHNIAAPFGGKNVDGIFRFTSGASGTIQSLDNDSYGIHDLVIYGKKGALAIGQYGFSFSWIPVAQNVTFGAMRELDWEHARHEFDKRSMLENTAAHAVECLEGKAKPRSTLESGYHTMQVLEALSRSAEYGGTRISI